MLYIFAAAAAILVSALFVPFGAELAYDGGFFADLRLLFIRLRLYPAGTEKKSGRVEREGKRLSGAARRRLDCLRRMAEKEPLRLVSDLVGLFRNRVWIKSLSADIMIACGDAAQTAITYGRVSAAAFYGLSVAERAVSIGERQIRVYPDFEKQRSDVKFSALVQTNLWSVLAVGTGLIRLAVSKNKKR